MKHRKSIWAANATKPKKKTKKHHTQKRQTNRGCRSATLDNARAQKATTENDMNERKNQFN